MVFLLIASLIWAFSFGLIKGTLTGLDSSFVSLVRMGISFILFAPFMRIKNIPPRLILRLAAIGGVQYGLMYLFYIYSYQFLPAYQVALFTVCTPLYVTLIDDAFEKKFNPLFLFTAALAVVGAGLISYREESLRPMLTGFAAIQASNLCFAFGQIYYKRILASKHVPELRFFGVVYGGAFLVTAAFAGATCDFTAIHLTVRQMITLLYLGGIASGLAFFLWNYGARRTDSGALAVFNNLKIPLAVGVSMIVFGESTDLTRLAIGGGIVVGALILNEMLVKRRILKAE
jgi:drug/metabolite transporter (DMT)-like permease